MTKRVRRTKEQIEASKGLGDTVEKVFKATGIDKVAKFILGEDCKCDERKAKLNALFPYKQPNCLTEDEYNYLNGFNFNQQDLKPSEQFELLKIYNRVFNQRVEPTSCGSCWRDMLKELKRAYELY